MFGKRITLFKLMGFAVQVDASWLILAVLVTWSLAKGYFPVLYPDLPVSTYWTMAVAGACGLFLSIVIHEFAHSVVARTHGIPMKGITLFIFGGVAEMDSEPPSAQAEFKMAIVGPATSAVLAAAFYAASRLIPADAAVVSLHAVLAYLALINAFLAAFNLIPAFPLDGGRVLRSFLWIRRKDLSSATRTASQVGFGFGTLLLTLGVLQVLLGNFVTGMWWFLIGMFLRGASQTSYRELQIRRALEGETVERFMTRDAITVPPDLSLADVVENYVYRHYHDLYPVLEGSRLLGYISLKELKKVPRGEWSARSVGELLQPCTPDNTIPPDTDAVRALSLMSRSGNSRLLVADGEQLRGVVTLKDLLNFLSIRLDLEGSAGNGKEMASQARRG
jgi:Zn-dependent protease/CBS domain-containing protein